MQAIIDSLPEHVLNYKDIRGKTIIDYDFEPFLGFNNFPDDYIRIIRPHYIIEEIECNGKKNVIKKKVEGNIQEAIDNKYPYIYIGDESGYKYSVNSYEDDVYRLLDAGHIRALLHYDKFLSNGKQYHVDMVYNSHLCDNITSYYSRQKETSKTVVLREPVGPVTNNLISLGWGDIPEIYPDTITSKFIGNTNYINARDHLKHQDILDMLEALKAKIEAL